MAVKTLSFPLLPASRAKGTWRVEVDRISLGRVNNKIRRIRNAALDAAHESFKEVTGEIKKSSQSMVPYKTGALHGSAFKRTTRRSHDINAVVGYDEHSKLGYAWIRHEVPAKEYTTPGTTHQYLSLAFLAYEDVVADIVRKAYRKELKVIGFKPTVFGWI